ncbi:MAG: class I SAM-dependent methyltransferase [Desulfobacterales bacterium]|nr:class I SAM-dependent methyltransferase [Desulfobacterales bacterium]
MKLHNFSYQIAGLLSPEKEPDKLHPKHRIMKYHDWFAVRLQKQWNVLDIGCGNGALSNDIKNKCRSVTGIDINAENIDMAKKKFPGEGVKFICANALEYGFKDNFDVIILSNVLEHIDRRVDFLIKIFDNQNKHKPPILLLRVPMITRDWITLYKKEVGVEWRLDPTHYTEYTLKQIFNEVKIAGLKIESYEIQFGEFYGVVKKKS